MASIIHEESQGSIQEIHPEDEPQDEIRVLHIDDEPDQLKFTKRFLEEADPTIHVESISSPEEVQHRLQQQAFDCVVSDYLMQGMDGIILARRVREKSQVPFILYTGHGSEEVAREAFAAGVDDYLKKEADSSHYQVLAKRIRMAVERHKAEESLREKEERLRMQYKGIPIPIYTWQRIRDDFVLVDYNDAAMSITKGHVDKHMGKKASEMYKQRPDIIEDLTRCFEEKKPIKKEMFYRYMSTGENKYLAVTYGFVQPDCILVHTEDITERKRMEENLEESRRHFQSLFNVMVDPVAIVDGEGTVLEITEAALEATGYKREELLGRNFMDLSFATEENKKILRKNVVKRLKGVDIPPYTVELITKDGRKTPHEVKAQRIDYKGKPAVMAVFRDITKRKLYEERLQALHRHVLKLASAEDLQQVCDTTLNVMESILGFEFISFLKVERDKLIVLGTRGYPSPGLPLPLDGKGITVRAARECRTIYVPDVREDHDFIDVGCESLSELAVPALLEGKAVAVLNVERRQLDAFTEIDRRLLELLAGHVASVIERLKKKAEEQKYQERLEALHGHASELTSTDTIEKIAELTFYAIERVLGFNKGSFMVVEGDFLHEILTRGVKFDKDFKMPLDGPGITVRAVRTGETQLVPDTRLDEDLVLGPAEGKYEPLSELAVPVKIDLETVAVINVENNILDAFSEDDRRLLEIFSEHVASAVRRLREQAEHQRYEERLEALHKHATELGKAESLQKIGETTFEAIERVLGFDMGGFAVVVEGFLKFIHIKGVKSDVVFKMTLDGPGITVRAVRTGETQLIPNTLDDEDYVRGPEDEVYERLSELAAPVKIGSEVVAVINVESNMLDAFTEEDRRLLETLALHVASAMERLRHIEMLRASEERFRTLLEESMDGTTVLVGTRIVYANKRLAELVGLPSPSEVIGRDALDFVAPEDREMVRTRALGRQRGEEHPGLYEYKMLRVDGTTIDIETYATEIEYGGKPASLALNREITERKMMERKLLDYAEHLVEMVEERTQELLDAERMVAAGRIASMVGHDLRGPLQHIINATYLLRKVPEKAEETLEMIENAVDRATRMLDELRNNTREAPIQMVATDLSVLIRRSVEEASPPATIDVTLKLGEGLEVVTVDQVKVRRVLDNLVGNALEAMPNIGCLNVEAERRGDDVIIKVSDTGVGIPEEDMLNLFKPFHTTKSKGMGLGLAYCKRAVEAHGGTITVESKDGEGATFTVTLPVKRSFKS